MNITSMPIDNLTTYTIEIASQHPQLFVDRNECLNFFWMYGSFINLWTVSFGMYYLLRADTEKKKFYTVVFWMVAQIVTWLFFH